MLIEDLLILITVGVAIYFVIFPSVKFIRLLLPKRYDPVKEARFRLDTAKQELEAARLDKETEHVYEEIYHDLDEKLKEGKK